MFSKARCARCKQRQLKALRRCRQWCQRSESYKKTLFMAPTGPTRANSMSQSPAANKRAVAKDPQTNTMASSPIHLHDFSEIAPESRGSLFEAFEFDENLTLCNRMFAEETKFSAAAIDGRGRQLLARTGSHA